MAGVSDVVCPWGRPVWGGLASYFNRGCVGFKAGWSLGGAAFGVAAPPMACVFRVRAQGLAVRVVAGSGVVVEFSTGFLVMR